MKKNRIEQEKEILEKMIHLYSKSKRNDMISNSDCQDLLDYAYERLDRCPFGNQKNSCRKCTIHCYRPVMRERVKKVMRFSGPRMLVYHPILAFRHLYWEMKKEKNQK